MCVAGSGGGTRFARLPPVIEIIPRSGYRSHLSIYTDMHRVRHTAYSRRRSYPDRGYTSVTAGKRSRQASVTRGYRTSTTNYPEAGSTSTHMCIISQTTQSVCNPGRGRYIYIYHAGGGTRFARLPPVIEIIPRSGYRSHLSIYTDMHRVRHTAYSRRRSYPDRGYTSVTAGKRSRQASVTRGYRTSTTNYPEAGSTSTHMCIISQTTQSVCNPGRGRYIYIYHAGGGTRFARLPPVIEIIPRSGYRSHLSLYADMHRVRHTACTRHSGYHGRGIAHAQIGKRPPNRSPMTFPSYKAR